jgi:hypothetical protein
MQDRTSANSMKVLLQRAAGPYIRVNSVGSNQAAASSDVCFAPKADNQADISLCPLKPKRTLSRLFDHLVGEQLKRIRNIQPNRSRRLEIDH